MRVAILSVLFFAFAAFAQKPTIEGLEYGVISPIKIELLEGCESQIFRWDGARLECLKRERVDLVIQQRETYSQATVACVEEVKYLRHRMTLEAMYVAARRDCQELGKIFNEQTAMCGGALPQKETQP